MKVRKDYVSNSSSSSFVVKERAGDAIMDFHSDFYELLNNSCEDPLGESASISIKTRKDKNEWGYTYEFDGFCKALKKGKVTKDDVTKIMFECDDWDATGMVYLSFLYRYFKALGYSPDDSDSERSFMENDTFLGKLLSRIQLAEENSKKVERENSNEGS